MSAAGLENGNRPEITKQAVVIVHGMGEQRPMETLRSFVETVYQRDLGLTDPKHQVDDPDLGRVNRVWIVPDQATGSVELRRITTPETKTNVRTDFFEFYWADIMEGTPLELVTAWIRGLLLRSPSRVPRRVPVWIAWIMLWILAAIFVVFSIAILQPDSGLFAKFVLAIATLLAEARLWISGALVLVGGVVLVVSIGKHLFAREKPYPRVKLVLPLSLIVASAIVYAFVDDDSVRNPKLWAAFLSAATAALMASVVAPYLGDVVRYVRATPATVAKREEVRERGLKLLRMLHDERLHGRPLYDRIVVVAHSLGAFVAYDLLLHLWEERGPNHKRPQPPHPDVVEALEKVDLLVKEQWPADQEEAPPPALRLGDYREAQLNVFHTLVETDQGWRISDFITLGSPLVHSEFLIADSRAQMKRGFEERLLSSSPPRPDRPKESMFYRTQDGSGPFIHFAAVFAAVRWTNIYDYHWFPLLGDIVSGPARPAFGPGIEEETFSIVRRGWPPVLRRFVTHTLYWAWQRGFKADEPPEYIQLLRDTLALNGLRKPNGGGRRGAKA